MSKGKSGSEKMSLNGQSAYGGKKQEKNVMAQSMGVKPSESGNNEVFASVSGIQTSTQGIPSSCNKPNIQNPADLLPKDSNDGWAQLNPVGKGDLANVNLLKAGYHIGIDTIGQTLRNANLQIRSEPPNPQLNVGPWNLSTIEPDFMRVPLEIGQGTQ
uniref:Minor capsid protein P11 C-terminal conserved region domain-containing protein n=1 Tax=viral metagenome TaxID=1070528 RepID=A0A6C0F658_9ZZZZ